MIDRYWHVYRSKLQEMILYLVHENENHLSLATPVSSVTKEMGAH